MFRTVNDFVQDWRNESQATKRVLDALTDASLTQTIAPGGFRDAGRMAWHIVTTIPEMMSRTGLELAFPGEGEHIPASAARIAEAYRQASEALVQAVQSAWTDASLVETSDMYGEQWPNGLTLDILIKHEIHHRGQLTVLMRQAGLVVPDVYGPTLEQWKERGIPAPAI